MALVTNWKTTVSGLVTALGVYFTSLETEPFLKSIGQILTVLGPILLGWFAKDASTESSTPLKSVAFVKPTLD